MSDSDLSGLIERVKGASGPDREIDLAIFRALGAPLPAAFATHKVELTWDAAQNAYVYVVPNSALQVRYDPPAYTRSLDAALSLVSAKLPGWTLRVGQNVHHKHWTGALQRVDELSQDIVSHHADHPTSPALALITALLLALQPQGQPDV
jgi:hypothetical protein